MSKVKLNIIFILLSFSIQANSNVLGVNYDPPHSIANDTLIQQANKPGNIEKVKEFLNSDFKQIKANGFDRVKTYISYVLENVDIADYACAAHLDVILGVREYDSPAQTDKDIQSVLRSVKAHPQCIKAIVVGNEDINTMLQRISNDISRLRTGINGLRNNDPTIPIIPIGTAQTKEDIINHSKSDLIPQLDFIGVNIYPYFTPEKDLPAHPTTKQVNDNYTGQLNVVKKAFPGKIIVVTEEGWPSQYNDQANPKEKMTNLTDESNYYTNWRNNRKGSGDNYYDNYYFSFYDKKDSGTSKSADNHFGLCTSDGKTKNLASMNCRPQ